MDTYPVEGSRESMIDILASWDLDGALPDGAGMRVVRKFVAGDLTHVEAIEEMKIVPLTSGRILGSGRD